MNKELLEQVDKARKQTLDILKEELSNKDIPLEDRWNSFVECGEKGLLPKEPYIQQFDGEIEEWMDNDVLDGERTAKYETVAATSTIERALDDEKSEEFVNDLKEQWMKKFIWSFKFDW